MYYALEGAVLEVKKLKAGAQMPGIISSATYLCDCEKIISLIFLSYMTSTNM